MTLEKVDKLDIHNVKKNESIDICSDFVTQITFNNKNDLTIPFT